MEFIKKVVVLKQVADGYQTGSKNLSGIARIEIEDGVCTLFLSVVGFKGSANGSYYVFIEDSNREFYYFELGARPISKSMTFDVIPNLNGGFAVGIVYIKDEIPQVVAYQREENCDFSLCDFKKGVANLCVQFHKQNMANVKSENFSEFAESKYNDEAVATENYYEIENEISSKIADIGEKYGNVPLKDERKPTKIQEIEEESPIKLDAVKDEVGDDDGEKYSEQNPYYLSAGGELEDLFSKFPEETGLKKVFFDSKWVKINYQEDKYYVVGVVKEKGKEKYICYGIPSRYTEKEPKELEGYCSFVPLSVFDLKGDGYWMMFQDAITGECVHIKK